MRNEATKRFWETADAQERLLRACREGRVAEARRALRDGGDPNLDDPRGSPLSWAAVQESASILRLVLKKGGDLKRGGEEAEAKILWNAARFGRGEALRILLEAGADPNAGSGGTVSAGVAAAITGNIGMVRDLLEFGWDPRRADRSGMTAREAARRREKGEVERLLGVEEERRSLEDAAREAPGAKARDRGL